MFVVVHMSELDNPRLINKKRLYLDVQFSDNFCELLNPFQRSRKVSVIFKLIRDLLITWPSTGLDFGGANPTRLIPKRPLVLAHATQSSLDLKY